MSANNSEYQKEETIIYDQNQQVLSVEDKNTLQKYTNFVQDIKYILNFLHQDYEIYKKRHTDLYQLIFDTATTSNSKEKRILGCKIICQLCYDNEIYQNIFMSFGGLSLNKNLHLFTVNQGIKSSVLMEIQKAYEANIVTRILNSDSMYWTYPNHSLESDVLSTMNTFNSDPYFQIVAFSTMKRSNNNEFPEIQQLAKNLKEKNSIRYIKMNKNQSNTNHKQIRSKSQQQKRVKNQKLSNTQFYQLPVVKPSSSQENKRQFQPQINPMISQFRSNEKDQNNDINDNKLELINEQMQDFESVQQKKYSHKVQNQTQTVSEKKKNNVVLIEQLINPSRTQKYIEEINEVSQDNLNNKYQKQLSIVIDEQKNYLESTTNKMKRRQLNDSYCSFDYKAAENYTKDKSNIKADFINSLNEKFAEELKIKKNLGLENGEQHNQRKILFNGLSAQAFAVGKWGNQYTKFRVSKYRSSDIYDPSYPKSPRSLENPNIKMTKKSQQVDILEYFRNKQLKNVYKNPTKILLNEAYCNQTLSDTKHKKIIMDIIRDNKDIYGMKRNEYEQIISFRNSDRLDPLLDDCCDTKEDQKKIDESANIISLIKQKKNQFTKNQKIEIKKEQLESIAEYFPGEPVMALKSKLKMVDEEQVKKELLDKKQMIGTDQEVQQLRAKSKSMTKKSVQLK